MPIWQDILATALLGTEQQPPDFTWPADALGHLLGRLDGANPEAALLSAAGALAVWRQAGYRAASAGFQLPPPCEEEERACCNPVAAQHLMLMLQGPHADVLPDWLTAVAERGWRVPEAWLPDLLDWGRNPIKLLPGFGEFTGKTYELRPLIAVVIGRRGLWLARRNPAWHYLLEADETAWKNGSRDERLALLKHVREVDADRARALLTATWSQEPAKGRAAFLAVFTTGLSPADEPFLEEALTDRAQEVRRVAADLLARLPTSCLARRMVERAKPLLTWQAGGWLSRDSVEANPPEHADPAMIRDGIDGRMPDLGERAAQLGQIIGAVPPSLWCEHWQKTPADIIKATEKSDWRQALLAGWSLATRRHRDAGWAEALLMALPDESPSELLELLPTPRWEAYVLIRLRADTDVPHNGPWHANRPWSPEFTRAIVGFANRELHRVKFRALNLLALIARLAPVDLADEIVASWREQTPPDLFKSSLEQNLALLRFRREMHQALAESITDQHAA